MRSIVVFLLVFLMSSTVFAQESIRARLRAVREDIEIKRTYHPNGSLETEGRYVQGQREGVFKWYHSNGELIDLKNYRDDRQLNATGSPEEGMVTWNYPDGSRYSERTYKDGKLNGVVRIYRNDGTLIKERNYFDDQLDGAGREPLLVEAPLSQTPQENHPSGQIGIAGRRNPRLQHCLAAVCIDQVRPDRTGGGGELCSRKREGELMGGVVHEPRVHHDIPVGNADVNRR